MHTENGLECLKNLIHERKAKKRFRSQMTGEQVNMNSLAFDEKKNNKVKFQPDSSFGLCER